ncbi:MAG: polysaccharide biosynthesis/export family protein [Candidatus Entotheonellia bacterium]
MNSSYAMLIGCGMLLAGLWSCANVPVQADLSTMDTTQDQETSEDYKLGPEDVIEVLVWKNEALSKKVTVRPDGKISLPLIGDVDATGLTAMQVKAQITETLAAYYKEPPDVSVIVEQAKSYVIYLLGEIASPGQYVVKRGTTFLQALALGGGFTPFASKNDILLLRSSHEDKKQIAIKIRYKDILSGKYAENNILLKPGDTIIIP